MLEHLLAKAPMGACCGYVDWNTYKREMWERPSQVGYDGSDKNVGEHLALFEGYAKTECQS